MGWTCGRRLGAGFGRVVRFPSLNVGGRSAEPFVFLMSPNPSVPLSRNEHLLRWVDKMAALCRPAAIHWVDGSAAEYEALCALLVAG